MPIFTPKTFIQHTIFVEGSPKKVWDKVVFTLLDMGIDPEVSKTTASLTFCDSKSAEEAKEQFQPTYRGEVQLLKDFEDA